MLKNLVETFERYVSLPAHASTALALGVVLAHTHTATSILPLIALVSPTKRCGKTTLLMLAGALMPRTLLAGNLTAAAVFRTIEKYTPTLLLDEADSAFAASDELRTLYNAGHTRSTALVIRTVGDDHEPRGFSTWCPKWLALIGTLPSTLMDRAIVIPMQRRSKGAKVLRLRQDRLHQHHVQAQTIARWAVDHLEALKDADPALPEELHDRAQDNWRPLIAIADLAGGEWPQRARRAALALSGIDLADEDPTELGTMLLADLRSLFDRLERKQLATTVVLEQLLTLDERPWQDYARGKAVFDNEDGGFGAELDYSEIAIARRLVRGGEASTL